MIKSAEQYSISDVFNIEQRNKYHIPKYQREFVWGKHQWEELFNDIIENERGYFIGSTICINRARDSYSVTPLEVVDGQQRLITISIMFASIYKKFSDCDSNSEEFITIKNNLKKRLIFKNNSKPIIELSYQNNNYKDYLFILEELGLTTKKYEKKPLNFGNRRIGKAYSYMCEKIFSMKQKKVEEVLNKITAISLVKIEVANHADAFILFESLNNRGIPLTSMDLIKNKLLAALDKKRNVSAEKSYSGWMGLIDNLPEYKEQERFVRHYYNAFTYDNDIKIKGIQKATKSKIIHIYNKLIKRNPEKLLDNLINRADIYSKLINPKGNSHGKKIENRLEDIKNIGASPAYSYLLFLFSSKKYKPNEKIEILRLIEKYSVIRSLTDYPGTRRLDDIYINMVKFCEERKRNIKQITKFITKKEKFAGMDLFKNKLEGDVYDINASITRYILCKIEKNGQTKENYTDLWKREKTGKYIWTIEHIFPEGKRIPKSWVKMIANGNYKNAIEIQEKYVHKIGNLTLTGYNSNLSNFDFKKKLNRKDINGKNIGYKNGLYLNNDLIRKQQWKQRDIEKRTKKLVGKAMKLFEI